MTDIIQKTDIKQKLTALFETLLEDSKINKAFRPVILNLGRGFLEQVSNDDLRDGIMKFRKELIPWLLDEDQNSE